MKLEHANAGAIPLVYLSLPVPNVVFLDRRSSPLARHGQVDVRVKLGTDLRTMTADGGRAHLCVTISLSGGQYRFHASPKGVESERLGHDLHAGVEVAVAHRSVLSEARYEERL